MDDGMLFSRKVLDFDDLANNFKVLIKFGLKFQPNKYQFFIAHLAYMDLIFTLIDSNPSHTQKREKYDAIIKTKSPESVKDCRSFCSMVRFLVINSHRP